MKTFFFFVDTTVPPLGYFFEKILSLINLTLSVGTKSFVLTSSFQFGYNSLGSVFEVDVVIVDKNVKKASVADW